MKSINRASNRALPAWAAAVVVGAAAATVTPALGQAVPGINPVPGAQRAQQEREEERARDRASRQEQGETRSERQQIRREREQLENMPQSARRVLRAETEGASNIDYFKIPGKGGERNQFGATFTKADGHQYDIRVDRDGNVVSRRDLTAEAQAAARPATPAPAQPAPTPAPGTATPAPTPAPAPTPPPTASGEAPKSGDPIYRRLQPNEVPANIRAVLDREAQGKTDVKYYRSKYGRQLSYAVRFDDASGREHAVHVADDGTVLARSDGDDDNEAQTASGRQRANTSDDDDRIQTGRVELDAMPRQVQTQFRRLTEGASNAKFYRTKYGNQQAYQANFTSRDGKSHKVFVDENGKILSRKEEGSDRKS